jgi:hypothetical protein
MARAMHHDKEIRSIVKSLVPFKLLASTIRNISMHRSNYDFNYNKHTLPVFDDR